MAAALGTETTRIRCPFCLAENKALQSSQPEQALRCIRCKKPYIFKNALATKSESKIEPKSSAAIRRSANEDKSKQLQFWLLIVPLSIGLFFVLSSIGREFDGPTFIITYVFIFIGLRILAYMLQTMWWDSSLVIVSFAVLFVSLGVHRYYYASQIEGMESFSFLFFAIIIGAALFFSKYSSNSSDGSSWMSSDCSGGCGGGGGCGGCG